MTPAAAKPLASLPAEQLPTLVAVVVVVVVAGVNVAACLHVHAHARTRVPLRVICSVQTPEPMLLLSARSLIVPIEPSISVQIMHATICSILALIARMIGDEVV